MKRDDVVCDICSDTIPDSGYWATFKRSTLKLVLRHWRMVSIDPVYSDWVDQRVDICNDCWDELVAEVAQRVGDSDV